MCRYSWEFTVLGQRTTFPLPGCKVRLLVAWSITDQSSPAGRTRVSGLLGVEVRRLMVATWFSMRSCPWRCCARLLYLCTCGTLRVSVDFQRDAGIIDYVSSGMMWSARWGDHLGACPGWNDMSPCGSIHMALFAMPALLYPIGGDFVVVCAGMTAPQWNVPGIYSSCFLSLN